MMPESKNLVEMLLWQGHRMTLEQFAKFLTDFCANNPDKAVMRTDWVYIPMDLLIPPAPPVVIQIDPAINAMLARIQSTLPEGLKVLIHGEATIGRIWFSIVTKLSDGCFAGVVPNEVFYHQKPDMPTKTIDELYEHLMAQVNEILAETSK